jgi:hypothetical protein
MWQFHYMKLFLQNRETLFKYCEGFTEGLLVR